MKTTLILMICVMLVALVAGGCGGRVKPVGSLRAFRDVLLLR